MSDVKFQQGTNGQFDIVIENGDLANESGFDTALFISLLTDGRAPESRVLRPEDRRGWIGDIKSPVDGRNIGGLLWLVEQRKLNQTTVNEAVDFAKKSLNWLLEDNIAKNIEVSGSIVPRSGISLDITTTAPSGETTTHYVRLWELTGVN